jgi:hypothetical protein
MNKYNRIDSPEIDPNVYSQMTFNNSVHVHQNGKNFLWQMVQGQMDSHKQNNEDRLPPHFLYKSQLKIYQWPKCKSYNYLKKS